MSAESGRIVLVTNEGNSRFCLAATRCHIVLVGIEKIVPRDRDLAVLLNGAGERAEATEQLLYVIRKKRDWNEEAARKQLVKFFEAWGPKDEFTLAGRRKLSSVLFS